MPATIEQYRLHHLQRQSRRLEKVERKRRRILAGIEQAASIAQRFGAKQIVIFGSVLERNKFHEHSDVDILVSGMPLQGWLPALLAMEEIPEFADVVVDLKRAEELPEGLVALIMQRGLR